ncbi:MAG TPA: pyridoxine 5'-phosphate synthase [Tepidisphaeraceae bacterium]|nr:pyridoxine 5'-phosphate synthase [Tepidisphaeraceae bacterium]
MIELGVNIDHIATIRQARRTYEPDPVWAAAEAELGGADGITVHLREDRRHITDRDVEVLRRTVQCKLNLEMSLAADVVEIAERLAPAQATLVPERRQEVTTEGGIDLTGDNAATPVVDRLKGKGVLVSAFIDPDERQIRSAARQGFDAIELHTGDYANAYNLHPVGGHAKVREELARLQRAAELAADLKLRLHAGHGLNYRNVGPVAALPSMVELNIGHAIVSRAVFVGLREAVREMKRVMVEGAKR